MVASGKQRAALQSLTLIAYVLMLSCWLTNVIKAAEANSRPNSGHQQPHSLAPSPTGSGSGKHQELHKHLNQRQSELVHQNPGSLAAVARALKMAIIECQHQMRHEPWDCPIYGFSTKPVDVFGKLMSRSFKETSFIHSLLSAALTHSVARACTESLISTCGRKLTRDGGYSEDVEFGQQFAQEFMDATHEPSLDSTSQQALLSTNSIIDRSSNEIAPLRAPTSGLARDHSRPSGKQHTQAKYHKLHQYSAAAAGSGSGSGSSNQLLEQTPRKDMTIKNIINAHNDELGRLLILNNMRRACKCHGLSGACNMQTCWLKLPSFREVANQLHDKFDQAIRLISVTHRPINKPKPLTLDADESTSRKSNKKRSSVSNSNQMNSLSRSASHLSTGSLRSSASYGSSMPLGGYLSPVYSSEPASIIGSRPSRDTKRHTSADDCDDCYRSSALAPAATSQQPNGASNNLSPNALSSDLIHNSTNPMSDSTPDQSNAADRSISISSISSSSGSSSSSIASSTPVRLSRLSLNSTNSPIKKRPVARSIGFAAHYITPSKLDLLYNQNSPDFCTPSERYDIKGTRGRLCSENPNASNKCETLCCGRGYKTEVREEKYNCECQFKFCCQLDCKTCTRRKVIHKCL